MLIEDGKGRGRLASVNQFNRLEVESESNVRGYFISRDDERLFGAYFADASAAAGDYVAYLKNTSSTRNMFIDIARVGAANAALWKFVVATGTATGGNTVTEVNYNLSSGIEAEATLLADNVGGFTAGSVFTTARNTAGAHVDIPFDDTLILGPQNAFTIEYDTGTTGVAEAFVRFFFEDLTVKNA